VSYTGPKGTSYSRRLLDTTDPGIMTGLKVGDRVDLTWTEAVRMSVLPGVQATPAAVPVPAPDDFRHRFTISAQWGVDNQFSGEVIEAANGQTTGGVPINLGETSYDDVYGRMPLFKVGVGYRTSVTWAVCRMWTGSSKRVCATSTARALVGPSRS
jgi:hypothetical protein